MLINKILVSDNYQGLLPGEIDLSDVGHYCALVGLNGSGKSSVINSIINYYIPNNGEDITPPPITFDKDIKPKSIISIYNGESKFGSRLTPSYDDNPIIFQLDSSIWLFTSYILQILNDPHINQYKLKNDDIEIDIRNAKKNNIVSFWKEMMKQMNISMQIVDKTNNVFNAVYSYIKSQGKEDIFNRIINLHSISHDRLEEAYKNTLQLSEGQKAILVLTLILKYLADEKTLVLLDEPDAYLDIQKKKEFFNLIDSCKGQIILTTHDPILTNLMKNHLIFMEKGLQISKNIPKAIKELSEGELSYQETLFILSESKHFVFVEGKTDIAFIKKAIEKLGYSRQFDNITFLSLGTSGAVEDKYYTTIAELLPKDTKKVLFLFDADNGGSEGKKQIDKIIQEHNDISNTRLKLNKKIKDLENITDEKVKNKIRMEIKELEDKIEKVKKVSFNPNKLLSYYFYNNNDNFSAKQDDDKMKWFYLEDYFKVDTYPDEYKVRKKDIKNSFKDFLPEKDSENDVILKFRELEAFGQRCKNQKFSSYATKIKEYFKEKLYLIDKVNDFEPFRPLLDKILEKLELKK